MRSFGTLSLALAVIVLSWPKAAHAYIDPGSGPLILQLIVGAVVGAAISLKFWKQKITNHLKKTSTESKPKARKKQ